MTTPVAFHLVTPVLRVDDLVAAIDYYVRALGFRVEWGSDKGSSLASVSRGDCRLFLAVGDQGHPGSWVWVGVSDVDALYDELLDRGTRLRQPPANYPWGSRELHAQDLDGNVLRFGSDNKPGEPFGDWLDMHGVRWRPNPDGGWTRFD
jgi:uncharacterized glyoxalase superfamily protein PhnB